MSTNTYTTETDPLGTFIVYQDGELCLDYVEASEAALRRQMLQGIAHNALAAVGRSTLATLRGIGSATMELFEAAAEAGREAA